MYRAFILVILLSGSAALTIAQDSQAERLVHEGVELTGAGQFAQAIRAFEEAIKLEPDNAGAYAALGRAYFKMREWQRAADYLRRAAALNAKQKQAKSASPVIQLAVIEPVRKTAQPPPTPHAAISAASFQPQKIPAPGTTAIQTSTSLAMKLNAIEAAPQTLPPQTLPPQTLPPRTLPPQTPPPQTLPPQTLPPRTLPPQTLPPRTLPPQTPPPQTPPPQTPPVATPDEQTASEEPQLKSEVATASEEKQEPTGVNVSANVSPVTPAESAAVTPIPLNLANEDVSLTKIYRIGPGDVLDVRINEAQPQQSTLFTVTPAGLLEHPLLAEPLNVSALTTEEIQTKIQDDLKTRALIENPAVTVGVRDYASHAVLVSGLVKDSGTKFLRREAIPLYVVVADAQPLPEAAKVTVVRNELHQVFEIDLTNVAHMNLLVRTGDVINLHPNETQFIYVGGEVKAPGEKIFRRGLTLTQAILSAGGMTPKSKVAEIGRDDGQGFLVKTIFKLQDIQTGKVMDPLIKPGDRIMIIR